MTASLLLGAALLLALPVGVIAIGLLASHSRRAAWCRQHPRLFGFAGAFCFGMVILSHALDHSAVQLLRVVLSLGGVLNMVAFAVFVFGRDPEGT